MANQNQNRNPSQIPRSVGMAIFRHNTYDLAKYLGRQSDLSPVLSSLVSSMYLDVVGQPNELAVYYLRLNLERPVNAHPMMVKGCILSMVTVGHLPRLKSMFTIKLTLETNPLAMTIVSFQFPLREHTVTVHDVATILRGRALNSPRGHRSDLTSAEYVSTIGGGLMGCRDFIAQWMIRLNAAGIIGLEAVSQQSGNVLEQEPVLSGSFHEILGNTYSVSNRRTMCGEKLVEITPRSISRCRYRDPNVRRVESHDGKTLPYSYLRASQR